MTSTLRVLIRRLYEFETCEATGGPLHIVLEEGAVEDSSLDFCERELDGHWSVLEADPADRLPLRAVAVAIISELRSMSVDARKAAVGE